MKFNKKKDEICLVSYTGQSLDKWAYLPIGMALLSAVLKEAEYRVRVLDLNVNPELEKEILKFKVIMFSMCAGKALSFVLDKIEEIKKGKKGKDKTVIVGGPLVMAMPERVLRETQADFVVYGDAERAIVKLMGYLEGRGRGELEKIKGVGYRDGDRIRINPPDIIEDLDSLPFPDLDAFDVGRYLECIDLKVEGRSLNWYTSRGCSFDCQFCFHEKKWRGQSAKRIVGDLKQLKEKYGVEGIWFFDDNFMNSVRRVEEFCELVKPLNLKWGCEARVSSINEDIVGKMKEGGCITIRNGFESGSDRILKVMRKGISVEGNKKAVLTLTKLDMPVKGGFMFGVPTETIEDAKETLKLIKWIYKVNPEANIWTYFYTPRPATEWYKLAVELGMEEFSLKDWTSFDKYDSLFYNLSNMTEKQIKKMMKRVAMYQFLANGNKVRKVGRYVARKVGLG